VKAEEHVETGGQDDWFVRATGMVGDLGDPFYREERERDVWNEASGSGVGLLYAHRLGVRVSATGRVLRLRLVPYIALVVLFLFGALRAASSSGLSASFVRGMAVGGAAAVLTLAWIWIRARRNKQLDDNS
jgi:hypothetical protein